MSRQSDWQQKQRRLGRCTICGSRHTQTFHRCTTCREKLNLRRRKMRQDKP